jgi:hypothetical protein
VELPEPDIAHRDLTRLAFDPSELIAFRYGGELQATHHIDGHVVVTDMHEAIRKIPKGATKTAHFVYRLRPAFTGCGKTKFFEGDGLQTVRT